MESLEIDIAVFKFEFFREAGHSCALGLISEKGELHLVLTNNFVIALQKESVTQLSDRVLTSGAQRGLLVSPAHFFLRSEK